MRKTFRKILFYILQIEARLVLWKYHPKVIAITGSVGKTSTKDAVYAVISKISHVRKSEKSYNSEIGLPLTVLGCPNGWNDLGIWLRNIFKGLWLILASHKYPKWLVLEVGVGKPGDMKKTASWIKSDVAIITAIGETPAHIEFFESSKHLIEEKSGLIKTLKKDGLLILNADDENVLALKEKTKSRVVTFGWREGVDVRGSADSIFYKKNGTPEGLSFKVDESGNSLPVVIEGVFGKNHIYASLGALALSFGLKFNILNAINALKNYNVPPGRMRLLAGINKTFLIDDTYNSSPIACESALQTLGEVQSKGRKIAVLGDMLELGKHTIDAHKNIGKFAKENADVLFVVGLRAKAIAEEAREAGMNEKNIFEFTNSHETGEAVKNFIKENDFILIKGSQGMRMERVVGEILLDKKNKSELLVRQDPEWLNKE
ncbi:MAG: UDP-N-acetylmuramoyl-tripeptide--D-alanyl-D-alanine ligase [bacterium]|nr:UDP-N-acetylmuramoyl-tripeptide--D-alanyl-D-alanine ligase [bacterium]